ncbi:MAG: hypothetical protein FWC32_04370 [Firmicutes bacterium]|nr:hypothetical protein [Bacillota bacterium]
MKRELNGNQEMKTAMEALNEALRVLRKAPIFTNTEAAHMANLQALANIDVTPPTKEQWVELYNLAKHVLALEPWRYLYETERITLLLPERDEPVYCITMGSGEMTYGICICPGYDSLNRLLKLSDDDHDDEANFSAMFEQHCINLYFGDREELEKEETAMIKELGLKFRGKNQWPYFHSMKPGYVPWHINREEAELTITVLQNYIMAFSSFELGLAVDFEDGQTLLRFYSPKNDMWYNYGYEMPPIPVIKPQLIIVDDMDVAQLKKKKTNKAELGVIIMYLPLPYQEERGARPKIPHIAFLVDAKSGMMIDMAFDQELTIEVVAIQMLTKYILNEGRPLCISVPCKKTAVYVKDFASKLGIKLKIDMELRDVAAKMISMMSSDIDHEEMLHKMLDDLPENLLEELLKELPDTLFPR